MVSQDKILIVEDDKSAAEDIAMRIDRMGYQVTGCVSGAEPALESVKVHRPDLILMKIELKGRLTGVEAAASIRAIYDIPVICFTSRTDEETREKLKVSSPYGYLVKPFADNELRAVVESTLYKHRAEQKIKESEQWFQVTLDSIGDGVMATDMHGVVTFMNPVAENLTGWPKSEGIGRPIKEVFNIINEYTREPSENPVYKVLRTGVVEGLANHTLLIRRDGHELAIKDSGAPIVVDGKKKIGVVLVFQDDSEARLAEKKLIESEAKFKLLFENAPLPYQSLDADGTILEVNRTWLEKLGYERDEVVGRNFSEYLHPDWQSHFVENFPKFKTIGEILGVEFEMRHRDGTYLMVRFDGRIGRDEVGAFLQTHCVFKDVTREVELQKQVEAQEAIIRQNQKIEALGTLAGGIAHDFNNILAAVIGYTELCFDYIKPGSQLSENLTQILSASSRAKDLVKQILTFSRQGDEEKQSINVCSLARDAVKMLRSTTPTSIELSETMEKSSVIIHGNASQINQVLVNLLTNAVHAIENTGRIELGIKVVGFDVKNNEQQLDIVPGEYAMISVTDNGIGIPEENLETIFDPYFTTKPPEKGSGLGLAVVYGIVKTHKGCIGVTSEPGKKTTFDVYLPLSELKQTCVISDSKPQVPPGKEHILVVDDEPALVQIHQTNLERRGYTVSVFQDSGEALAAIEKTPDQFDLLITDMTMPGMNGLQLTEAVKKICPGIRVVLCTGHSDELHQDNWQSFGLDALLMKPVENHKLAQTVRELLDSRSS